MTKPFLAPGCWGSVMAAQAGSAVCTVCPYQDGCFGEAVRVEAPVLAEIKRKLRGRLEDDDATATVLNRVTRYLTARKRAVDATPDRKLPRTEALARKFSDAGIDVAEMKRGVNPFCGADAFEPVAQVVLDLVAFKPKDVTDELKQRGKTINASDLSRFLTVLVDAGVLERREKNVLCLSQ
jgi:hypothetical protein